MQEVGFGLSFYASPGGIGTYNNDESFNEVGRNNQDSTYFYSELNFDYICRLPSDDVNLSWVVTGLAQGSGEKLVPSQQMNLGGMNTVRGYPENTAAGDSGFMLRNELRVTESLKIKNLENIQFLGFFDFGYLLGVNKDVWEKNSVTLSSVGAGFRYNFMSHVDIKLDYGYQLKKLENNKGKSRSCLHCSIIASY